MARLDAERAAAEAAEADRWMSRISLEDEGVGADEEETGEVLPLLSWTDMEGVFCGLSAAPSLCSVRHCLTNLVRRTATGRQVSI